jgi:seryl-tRNA synthetase
MTEQNEKEIGHGIEKVKKSNSKQKNLKTTKEPTKEEIKAKIRAKNYDKETLIEKYISMSLKYNALVDEYNDLANDVKRLNDAVIKIQESIRGQ